jgi:hypothetical protein
MSVAERILGFLREVFAATSLSYRPEYSAANGLIERGERCVLYFLEILKHPYKTATAALSRSFFIFGPNLSQYSPTARRPHHQWCVCTVMALLGVSGRASITTRIEGNNCYAR